MLTHQANPHRFDERTYPEVGVAHHSVEEPWFDEQPDTPKTGVRSGTLVLVAGIAAAAVAIGVGAFVSTGTERLVEDTVFEAPSSPLFLDPFLSMLPFHEPAGWASLLPEGTTVPGDGSPAAGADTSYDRSDDGDAARIIERTNAATDDLNRYELAKLRGYPDPLSEVQDEELRRILAEEEAQ